MYLQDRWAKFEKKPVIREGIIHIIFIAEIIPFILLLIFIKRIKSLDMRVFFAYTLVFSLGIGLNFTFGVILHDFILQTGLLKIMLVLEFAFISLYYTVTLKNRNWKVLILIANLLFWGYCNRIFSVTPPDEFPRNVLAIECLFFIVVIVYDFFEKMQQYHIVEPIYHHSSFWISVSFLIYFSGSVLLFIYYGILGKDPVFQDYFMYTYCFFAILKDLLLSVAVLVHAFVEKQEPNKNPVPVDLDLGLLNTPSRNPLTHQS